MMSFYKDPNKVLHCHVLGTCKAAFSTNHVSAVLSLRARGSWQIHFLVSAGSGGETGVSKEKRGTGPFSAGRMTLTRRNLEVLAPTSLQHTIHQAKVSLIWLLAQPLGYTVYTLQLST